MGLLGALLLVLAQVSAVDPGQSCQSQVSLAKAALAKKSLPEAKEILDRAERLVSEEPGCSWQYFAARGDLLSLQKDPRGAAHAYRKAAHLSPDRPAFKRLTALRISTLKEAKATQTPALLRDLLVAEDQLASIDRAPSAAALGKIAAMEALFSRDHDVARIAYAKAVRARIAAVTPKSSEPVEELASPIAKDAGLPDYVRASALEALVARALSAKDAQAEVAALARLDAIKNAKLPAPARRYARSARLERACAKLEKTEAADACVRIARAETGEWMLFDWSKKPPSKKLSDDDFDRAGRQYLPVVEACLREAVAAHPDDERFLGGDVRVGWSIGPDGKTKAVEIEPKRYDEPLGPCVRAEIATFRYPRTADGQGRSAQVPFHLDVVERTRAR